MIHVQQKAASAAAAAAATTTTQESDSAQHRSWAQVARRLIALLVEVKNRGLRSKDYLRDEGTEADHGNSPGNGAPPQYANTATSSGHAAA